MTQKSTTRINTIQQKKRQKQFRFFLIGGIALVLFGYQLFKPEKNKETKSPQIGGPAVQLTKTKNNQINHSKNTETTVNNQNKVTELPVLNNNTIRSYQKNWQPIKTNQSEPHATNYDDGSIDRLEMHAAIEEALEESTFYEWWLTNDGTNGVQATISNTDQSQYYYVYLRWISGQGWQPEKVDVLVAKPTS